MCYSAITMLARAQFICYHILIFVVVDDETTKKNMRPARLVDITNTVNNYNSRLYFNTIQVLIVVISISSKIFVFKMFPSRLESRHALLPAC